MKFLSFFSLRLFLLAAGHLLQMLPVSAGQQLDQNAIAAWKKYEQFSHSLQGNQSVITNFINRKDSSQSMRYRQNQEGALVFHRVDEEHYETIRLLNPSYFSELRRTVGDPSSVVLRDLQFPSATTPSSAKGTELLDDVFRETSPHFSYFGIKLSVLVSQPSFTINEASTENHEGLEWMRVQFRYVSNQHRKQIRKEGAMYLDPTRSWCLRRVKETEKIFRDKLLFRTMDLDTRYDVVDHPSGFPIIKHIVATYDGAYQKNNRKASGSMKVEYRLEVDNRVATSEFTLSAFGIPEPKGVKPPEASRTWIWLSAAVIGMAVLAMLFAWLKHRRTAACQTQNKSTAITRMP